MERRNRADNWDRINGATTFRIIALARKAVTLQGVGIGDEAKN